MRKSYFAVAYVVLALAALDRFGRRTDSLDRGGGGKGIGSVLGLGF